MSDATEAWCNRVRTNDRNSPLLILSGIFGCGKSHCLHAAHRYIGKIYMDVWPGAWNHGINYTCIDFPRFAWEIETNENLEHYDDVVAADVVFIDDIGAEEDRFKSDSATRILGDLLGALEKKFVMIATNIAPSGWKARWDGRVEDRLLRRNSVVVNLWDTKHATVSYAKHQLTAV